MDNQYKFIRYGGLGDELCLTPIYRHLRGEDPDCIIAVEGTHAKDILTHNPYVDMDTPLKNFQTYNILWHRDTGWGQDMHLVDFYAKQCGITLADRELDLYLGDEDIKWAEWMDSLPRPIVCYNSDAGWTTKEYRTDLVAGRLLNKDVTIIQVGNGKPYLGIGYNMVGYTNNIRQLGAMLRKCDLYLGNDSGIFHVASAVGTRCVVVFTSTAPECYIHAPDRELAIYNPDCYGCYNLQNDRSVVSGRCPAGNYECMKIDVDHVARIVLEILQEEPDETS